MSCPGPGPVMLWFEASICVSLGEYSDSPPGLQVSDLIKESRQALADSLFSWTCQSPLTKDDTLALIGHLETVTAQADGSLDSVNVALVMALLYCLDVSFIEQGTEDREGGSASQTFGLRFALVALGLRLSVVSL